MATQAATSTPAGTLVGPVIQLEYVMDGVTYTETLSGAAAGAFVVDELVQVGVDLLSQPLATVISPSDGHGALFRVVNTGNGEETFLINASNAADNDFDFIIGALYLDDGDGVFEPDADDGQITQVTLAQDASAGIWVGTGIPPGVQEGDQASLSLLAATLRGIGGGEGEGDGGSDIVISSSGGTGGAVGGVEVIPAALSFDKTFVIAQPGGGEAPRPGAQNNNNHTGIAQPGGGEAPVPGAIITYTLTVVAEGSAAYTDVVLDDPIPAATTYIAGSLTYDGAVQTDATDTDTCEFTAVPAAVRCALPPLNGPSTHVITFQVRID
jgi:uncharacterized repeat protein (TIGR01451 family)